MTKWGGLDIYCIETSHRKNIFPSFSNTNVLATSQFENYKTQNNDNWELTEQFVFIINSNCLEKTIDQSAIKQAKTGHILHQAYIA